GHADDLALDAEGGELLHQRLPEAVERLTISGVIDGGRGGEERRGWQVVGVRLPRILVEGALRGRGGGGGRAGGGGGAGGGLLAGGRRRGGGRGELHKGCFIVDQPRIDLVEGTARAVFGRSLGLLVPGRFQRRGARAREPCRTRGDPSP